MTKKTNIKLSKLEIFAKELLPNLQIVELNNHLINNISEVYVNAFNSKPWNEFKKCSNCKVEYGIKEYLENPTTCKNKCGDSLILEDYWGEKGAKNVFLNDFSKEGFVGVGGLIDKELGSISWGYKIPSQNNETALFSLIRKNLVEYDINPEKCFYAAESAVKKQYQGIGIGLKTSSSRILKVKNNNYENIIFRTINPKLINVFKQMYTNVRPLFNDPDPKKSNRVWYCCNFNDLK